MNAIKINGYTRISKAKARKLWSDTAVNLAFVPCNQVPGHAMGSTIHPSDEARTSADMDFDRYVRTFEVYNCTPARDVGDYTAFYVYEKP